MKGIENNNFSHNNTKYIVDADASDPTAIRVAKDPILSAHIDGGLPQYSAKAIFTSDPLSLPLDGAIDLAEAEADTIVIENIADTVINDDATSLSKDSQTALKEERRKRRTKVEKKALTDIVLQLLKKGYDPLAIALYLKESKTTVNNILVSLIADKRFTYTPPEFTIIRGGKFILDIKELGITKDGHACIKRNADGELVIRAFDPEELAQDADCISYQQ